MDTHRILDQQGIPVHYGWVDSWWYGERLHPGVTVALWEDTTANPPEFGDMQQRSPTGLTGMNHKTASGRKVVAHIGEWNAKSPYATNNVVEAFFNTKQTDKCCGEGVTSLTGAARSLVNLVANGFVNSGSHTLPTSEVFWQELMGKAKDWGLLVMKQDHINGAQQLLAI